MGFESEANQIFNEWNLLLLVNSKTPLREYEIYSYPNRLLSKISDIVLDGIKNSCLNCVSKDKLENLEEDNIVRILNESWQVFWKEPSNFKDWETKTVSLLKNNLNLWKKIAITIITGCSI